MKKIFNLQSLFILILFGIIVIQRCKPTPPVEPQIEYDTVYTPIYIHDTVQGDPIYIISKPDTQWIVNNPPDTNYENLKQQYINLGNRYFAENTFETIFPVDTFGIVRVTDKIKENQLFSSTLISKLTIPEKTITITKTLPPTRQLYAGAIIRNRINMKDDKPSLDTWPEIGLLYKDKKDRLFGASGGYNGNVELTVSTYWKINLKKK